MKNMVKRINLTKTQRKKIFEKTEGHCHFCGCAIEGEERWTADHVVPHAYGGKCDMDNFLPCCYECNRLRWFYKPEELKTILRLGVYCNKEMKKGTRFGKQITEFYNKRLEQNVMRRKK